MAKTKTEKLIQALIALGCKEKFYASKKYKMFKHPDIATPYFVGKAGGLRRGVTVSNSISQSYQVNDIIRRAEMRKPK